MTNLQSAVRRLKIVDFSWSSWAHHESGILSSYGEMLTCPITTQKMANLQNTVNTPLNHRFQLVLWFLPSELLYEAFKVKSLLTLITPQKIANLQNAVRRLQIIAFF